MQLENRQERHKSLLSALRFAGIIMFSQGLKSLC